MESYKKAYKELNPSQREAVDTIYGPVLVIAGPGTGKTQLISTRVGHILEATDTLPQNILCLTFTEAGATAMRERLIKLLGQAAYDIRISTYHAFGSELLRNYPEYLEESDLEPIDEVGRIEILRGILAKLPYDNPLKFAENYMRDIISFISDSKRALLSPKAVIKIADDNLAFLDELNKQAQSTLSQLITINKQSVAIFENLQSALKTGSDINSAKSILPLTNYLSQSLDGALSDYSELGKTTPLTKWKNKWLAKDTNGQFIFDGKRANLRLKAAGQIYDEYQEQLKKKKLFDYDDMILRAISSLNKYPDFKFSVAEQHQFIMLDEFQDTNPAQLELMKLLTDLPVNEGKPNILAVGDDDQAIYAFQGADHANMAQFTKLYKDVKVVSLKDNYRSHTQILNIAQEVAVQISERLHQNFINIDKVLIASNTKLPSKADITTHQFKTDAAEFAWITHEIKRLIDSGTLPASEIAILAPKHKYLQKLLPFLASANIAVRYEKRENILDQPVVYQLEQMARLVLALGDADTRHADAFWPEVLSYDFWGLKPEQIWQITWSARAKDIPLTSALLDNYATKKIAQFFLKLKDISPATTLEQQLDALIGHEETSGDLKLAVRSPFFEYYFGKRAAKQSIDFMNLLSSLNVLRARLRRFKRDESRPLHLQDFIEFIDAYRAAGVNILNTSPYSESEDAVNILTAYAAKGREFGAVFVINCQDEVWGHASRGQSSRISLPANISYIRYQGQSEDERLRLFFVAITRAKTHLYLTSYEKTLDGQITTELKYLNALNNKSALLKEPEVYEAPTADIDMIKNYWATQHKPPFHPRLKTLLSARLQHYKLSASHINQFIDVVYGGPEAFFIDRILRFPKAPTPSKSFGNAVHETLRFLGSSLKTEKKLPAANRMLKYFEGRLRAERLAEHELENELGRGRTALQNWVANKANDFHKKDFFEYNFSNEGVFIDDIPLSGKIDRIVLNPKKMTATVIDFKTGQPYSTWQKNVPKLHQYRQQLMIYKILIENSKRFAGYKVNKGILEFIEPDEEGNLISLELDYDKAELEKLKKLVSAIWHRVLELDFPDISKYPATMAGIRQFENDLLKDSDLRT
jgi:DNA helicase-2/ATP-dependent DNA helicase PcrA